MPGHVVHHYVDRQLFGKVFYKIHRRLDKPVFFLGKKHRVLYHDAASAAWIAMKSYPDDELRARNSAWVHIIIDQLCSGNPYFKKILEEYAYADAKRRRIARENLARVNKRGRQKKSLDREAVLVSELQRLLGFR